MNKLFLPVLLILTACHSTSGKIPQNCPTFISANLIHASKMSAEKSMNEVSPQEKVGYAKKVIEWGEKCVGSFPKEAGCYYYRAINTGLYYQAAVIRYQKGLKKILRDCSKIISLDEKYDGGGAFRILGNIYLKTPIFSLAKKAVTKNIGKAEMYASKAMEVAPNDLDNRLLWAEVLFEKENFKEAVGYLRGLARDLPKKRPFTWYDKGNLKRVKRLLLKGEKRLTKGR